MLIERERARDRRKTSEKKLIPPRYSSSSSSLTRWLFEYCERMCEIRVERRGYRSALLRLSLFTSRILNLDFSADEMLSKQWIMFLVSERRRIFFSIMLTSTQRCFLSFSIESLFIELLIRETEIFVVQHRDESNTSVLSPWYSAEQILYFDGRRFSNLIVLLLYF